MNKEDLINVRPNRQEDLNFIYSTWLNGLKYGNDLFSLIPPKIYFSEYSKILETLIHADTTEVKVAALIEDPDVIIGYSVLHPPHILHWIFVKPPWRKIGISKLLIPNTITTITHITKLALSIKPQAYEFNPFAL